MFTEPDWRGVDSSENSFVFVGDDTVIRENVIINLPAINEKTHIGSNCYIMNTCFIGHDCVIEDNVTLCPHVCVAGNVYIGEYTTIGMNASIHQGSIIGRCCMIGAGSFFKGRSPSGITWAGVPARPIKVNTIGIKKSDMSPEEKETMISNAQLFIDTVKSPSNVKAKNWITATYEKTLNIVFYCVGFFYVPYIFNEMFGIGGPSYRILGI